MVSIRWLCLAAAIAISAVWLPLHLEESATAYGEVLKVNLPSGQITIRHGPIKSLDMIESESTHDFIVEESMILNAVRAGEKIRFRARQAGGRLQLVAIQPAG